MLATPTQNPILQAALTAICPVGKVDRMYVGVGAGFIANEIAGLNLTAYWVSLNGGFTIGSAASGANIAQAWAQNLFTHLWTNDTALTLLTSAGGASSRGTSAVADWNANKRLTLPDARGRALIGLGQGSGMSDRGLGSSGGSETHALTAAEGPVHAHALNNTNHWVHTPSSGGTVYGHQVGGGSWTGNGSTTLAINNAGSGAAHNNMQPWLAVQTMVFAGFA